MEQGLKGLLQKVPDAYDDFVSGILRDVGSDNAHQEKLIGYLQAHPDAQTDDVIEYVDDELLQIP